MKKPRMLFVSPEFPWPPRSGGCLRTFPILEFLAQHCELHCVTFAEREPEPEAARKLRSMLAELTVLPLRPHRRTTLPRYVRNTVRMVRFVPPLVDRFAEPASRRQLSALLKGNFDLVWLEHLWLAPYVAEIGPQATKILDAQNVESDLFRQLRKAYRHWPEQVGYYVFEKAARRIEQRYLPSFDQVLAVSPEDKQLLSRDCPPERIHVVPNAVQVPPLALPETSSGKTLYFAGGLDYPPNRLAVLWFHQQVWPMIRNRLPEAKWIIVGACPELLNSGIHRDPQIVLAGRVETTAPYLNSSAVAVVPITLGGGTRVKILDAWAAGKAVLSTSAGAQGLEIRHGDNIWIADTPEEFGRGALQLLSDSTLRAQLGKRGWETVQDHYSLPRLHERLEAVLLQRLTGDGRCA